MSFPELVERERLLKFLAVEPVSVPVLQLLFVVENLLSILRCLRALSCFSFVNFVLPAVKPWK